VAYLIGVVGAGLLEQFLEVIGGLHRRRFNGPSLSRGDEVSFPSLLVLLALLGRTVGRALIGSVASFRLAGVGRVEDRPNYILTGSVIGSDVKELLGHTQMFASHLVDQGPTGRPGNERPDDVGIGGVGDRVTFLGKTSNVIP